MARADDLALVRAAGGRVTLLDESAPRFNQEGETTP